MNNNIKNITLLLLLLLPNYTYSELVWKLINNTDQLNVASFISDGSYYYCGTNDGKIYYSSNNGNSWNNTSIAGTSSVVSSIVKRGNFIYAKLQSAYNNFDIYKFNLSNNQTTPIYNTNVSGDRFKLMLNTDGNIYFMLSQGVGLSLIDNNDNIIALNNNGITSGNAYDFYIDGSNYFISRTDGIWRKIGTSNWVNINGNLPAFSTTFFPYSIIYSNSELIIGIYNRTTNANYLIYKTSDFSNWSGYSNFISNNYQITNFIKYDNNSYLAAVKRINLNDNNYGIIKFDQNSFVKFLKDIKDNTDYVISSFSRNITNNNLYAIVNGLGVYQLKDINPISVNFTENYSTCEGGFVTIKPQISGGNSQFFYNWTNSSGQTISNDKNLSINPSITSDYYLEVTDTDGEKSPKVKVTVIVYPKPSASINGTNQACAQTIINSTTNSQNPSFAWYKDGKIISGQTKSDLLVSSTGVYTVEITDNNTGCSNKSSGFEVTIYNNPTEPTITGNTNIFAGQSTTLIITEPFNCKYNWYNDSLSVNPFTTTNSYSTPKLNSSTVYWVEAEHLISGCKSKRKKVIVNVSAAPKLTVFLEANNVNICSGKSTTLKIKNISGGNPPYSYKWFPNIYLNRYDLDSAVFYSIKDTTITFTLTVTDKNNLTGEANVTITVKPLPSEPIVIGQKQINEGETATLTATAPANCKFYWYTSSSGGIGKEGKDFTTPILNSTTDFYIEAEDTNTLCRSPRKKVTVEVAKTKLKITQNQYNNAVCKGNSITLSVTVSGGKEPYKYEWTPNKWIIKVNDYTVNITPDSNITYSVYITDDAGIKDSSKFDIKVKPLAKEIKIDKEEIYYCSDSKAKISILNSENGVLYELKKNNTTIDSKMGNNSNLEFNNLDEGNYSFIGTLNDCPRIFSNKIKIIKKSAIEKPIINEADNEIISIWDISDLNIKNPDSKLIYEWYINNTKVYEGKNYTLKDTSGTLYVIAKDTSNGVDCINKSTTYKIVKSSIPYQFSISIEEKKYELNQKANLKLILKDYPYDGNDITGEIYISNASVIVPLDGNYSNKPDFNNKQGTLQFTFKSKKDGNNLIIPFLVTLGDTNQTKISAKIIKAGLNNVNLTSNTLELTSEVCSLGSTNRPRFIESFRPKYSITSITPNPSNNIIKVSLIAENTNYKLFISDLKGNKIKEIETEEIKDTNEIAININELTSGKYFLILKANDFIISKDFEVIK